MSLIALCMLTGLLQAAESLDHLFLSFEEPQQVNLEEEFLDTTISYEEDVHNLLIEGKRQGFFHFRAMMPLFNETLVSGGELAYSALELEGEEAFEEYRHRLLRFVLLGKQRQWSYGVEYGYVGEDFEDSPQRKGLQHPLNLALRRDREGGKVGGRWTLGVSGITASLTEFWNNVDEDPNRPRHTTIQGEMAWDIALPSWPFFSVFYKRGTLESSQGSEAVQSKKDQQTVGTRLFYGRPRWDVTLTTSYALAKERLQREETRLFSHELRVSYRPLHALTIAPALSLSREEFRPSHVGAMTQSVALSFTYSRLLDVLHLTTYGSYSRSRRSDGFVDARTIDVITNLTWSLPVFSPGKATVSCQIAYTRYLDMVYPNGSSEELSAQLILKLTPLPV
jgi:hypothetical protein